MKKRSLGFPCPAPYPKKSRVPRLRLLGGVLLFLPWCSLYAASTLVFPQLIQGPGTTSYIVLMNAGSLEDEGQIDFFDPAGEARQVMIEGKPQSSVSYSIPSGGFTLVEVSGTESLSAGYALVHSDTESARLTGSVRIRVGEQEIVLLDAPARTQHQLFIEQASSTRTGLAMVNLASEQAEVSLQVLNERGVRVANQSLTVGPGEQLAQFVDEIFEELTVPFQGVLKAVSTQALSVTGIRQSSDGGLSPLPSSRSSDSTTGLPGPELFSGQLALEHVKDQLAWGPRPTGSGALLQAGDEIRDKLHSLGWQTEQDLHTLDLGSVQIPVRNLVARKGQGPVVILATHYDTRVRADRDPDPALRLEKVPGANDGGSGTAVLLELARLISEHYQVNNEIRQLFFDAEDNGGIDPWRQRAESLGGWVIGSSLYARNLDLESQQIQFVIVVDMVGDMEQRFPKESFSVAAAPDLVDTIWNTAASLGFGDVFLAESAPLPVLDDHRPFIDRGLPALDIIDLDYPFWHTTQDTLDKVSPESLERIGMVLQTFLMQRGVLERKGE